MPSYDLAGDVPGTGPDDSPFTRGSMSSSVAAARTRDAASARREAAAAARDTAAAARDALISRRFPAQDELVHYQALAAEDRRRAGRDRVEAARARRENLAELESLAALLAGNESDPLTGARSRAAGLADLDAEIARCRRNDGLLTVAYLDVIGLKAVNDTLGHAAGDALLVQVVGNLRAHLRPYDLIARLGSDEFLCALPGLSLAQARGRFAAIISETARVPDPRRLRVGLAALEPGDTVDALISRADRETTGRRRALALAPPPDQRPGADGRVDLTLKGTARLRPSHRTPPPRR